jgi:hypothetical protein
LWPGFVVCGLWKAAERLLNRLHEPIVRLSTTNLQPRQDLVVECELRAKRPAIIRDVRVGFQSEETRGEDSHTQTYEPLSMAQPNRLDTEPAAVRHTVKPPALPKYKWSNSSIQWYVTVEIDVDNACFVRRRYRIVY